MTNPKGFLVGAVQTSRIKLPALANPMHRRFDLDCLDQHVQAVTARALALFDKAGQAGLELVLGLEDMQQVAGVAPLPIKHGLLDRYSHRIQGPLTEQLGQLARRHNMHLGACFYERAGSRHYNAAVLMGPGGRLIGKYRKVHLPPQEACVFDPGRDFPTWKTQLGRIGFMICYDMMFPESARCLTLNGADLILHPTLGYGWTERIGDIQSRARCADNDVYMVIACTHRSQVIDPWGDVLADAGRRRDAVVHARIDPRVHRQFLKGHYHSAMTGLPLIRQEMLCERRPKAYGLLTQAAPPVRAAIKGDISSPRRKRHIRKLLAAELESWGTGRKFPCHWTAR